MKRLTIATALIVTVAVLALNKEKWLPQAKDAAIVLGQNVDKLAGVAPGPSPRRRSRPRRRRSRTSARRPSS